MARAKKTIAPEVLEIDGIPTAAGLARRGLAQRRIDRRGRAYFQLSDEGYRVVGEALRRRATENTGRKITVTREKDQP